MKKVQLSAYKKTAIKLDPKGLSYSLESVSSMAESATEVYDSFVEIYNEKQRELKAAVSTLDNLSKVEGLSDEDKQAAIKAGTVVLDFIGALEINSSHLGELYGMVKRLLSDVRNS